MSNPTRNPFKRAHRGLDEPHVDVDAYKARSVWGAWWDLRPETRARYFSGADIRFVQRYGSRLDKIASMVELPANPGEQHFYDVCNAGATPKNDSERLWLRVQLVCRYERSIALAMRAETLEYEMGPLKAEVMTLHRDLREAEAFGMEILAELRMHGGEMPRPPASICNVRYATPLFAVHASAWPRGSNQRRIVAKCR